MTHKLFISAAAAIMVPLAGMAQSLNKEITVERDIVPEQREATRIGFTPRISLRPVALKQLAYSENGVTARVPASISVLDPAAYADSIYISPYRGYVAAGFMPRFNAAFSLGYRIIDTERTRLGAWLQYDGTSYNHTFGEAPSGWCGTDERFENTYKRHTASANLALHQLIGSGSAIDANFDYTFAAFNNYSVAAFNELFNQNVNRINADARWSSNINDLKYAVGARFSGFGFGKDTPKSPYYNSDFLEIKEGTLAPVKETVIDVNASLRAEFDDRSLAELGLEFSSVGNNRRSALHTGLVNDIANWSPDLTYVRSYVLDGLGSYNHWLLRLTPRYRYISGIATVDLGVKIDLTHNADKAFHIAPDVTIGLNPSSKFAVSFRAGGGEVQNTLSSLYDINPYAPAFMAFGNSHVPFTFDADITVGPFYGAYLTFFGGYAKANDWLMPTYGVINFFSREDVKGWHAGVAAGYKWRDAMEARVSFETASHSDTDASSAYYLWRDRAKLVADASVRVTPIAPLDITLGYNLRTKRSIFPNELGNTNSVVSLESVSNLSAGASWRFTPQFTVFLKGENLLNHQYALVSLIPAQGLTGLAGLSYKF